MVSNGIRTTTGRGRLFQSILDTVGETPAVRINNLAPQHVTIYAKAEFFNPGASVKDRLALNIIEEGERSGALQPGQTVVLHFDLMPTSYVFPQGHHPQLTLMGADYRERGRDANIEGAHIQISSSAATPAWVDLPVITP